MSGWARPDGTYAPAEKQTYNVPEQQRTTAPRECGSRFLADSIVRFVRAKTPGSVQSRAS